MSMDISKRRRWRGLLAAVPALAVALTLGACGSESGDSTSTASPATAAATSEAPPEMTKVKASVIASADYAPVFIGQEHGFFEEEGIDLDLAVGGLSATVFPQLVNGQMDMFGSALGSMITAVAQGLPLVTIAPTSVGGNTLEDDTHHIIALKSSGIESLEDLKGKTMGVPALGQIGEAVVRVTLEEAGLEPSDVRLVAVNFPDMPAALSTGKVDSLQVGEPFLTVLKQSEDIVSLAPGSGGNLTDPPFMGWIASEKYVEENPDVVRRFQRAWKKAVEYTIDNPDEARTVLSRDLKVDESVAAEMILPRWTTASDPVKLQEVADLMTETGVLDEKVDVGSAVKENPLP